MQDDFHTRGTDPHPELPIDNSVDVNRGPFYRDPSFIAVMVVLGIAFISTWCLEHLGLLLHSRLLVGFARLLEDFGIGDYRVFHGQVWRLLTNVFLHAGFGHLFGNLLFLVPLVALVRSFTRTYWWLAVFLVSGMAGSLLQVAFYPNDGVVGASGAIAGLAGAALVCGWRLLKSGQKLAIALPALVVLAYLVFSQFIGEISGQHQEVAHMAHLGGLIAGVLMGRRIPLRST